MTHIKQVHEGKKFSCESCDYLATQQSNLKRHIESEDEKKKFPCETCDYLFTV